MSDRGMRRERPTIGLVLVLVLAVSLPAATAARAEWSISGALGASTTGDADVQLTQPGGNDLRFSDVAWSGKSFESPVYYGIRFAYWLKESPAWGLALDYSHAKMLADLDASVSVDGVRDGTVIEGMERLGDTFGRLEFTDGHNLVLFTGLYRFFAERTDRAVQPYLGLGLGAAVPHVETLVDGMETFEFQVAGPAVQGLVGVEIPVARAWSLFAESKLAWARISADLEGNGSLSVKPWTAQLAAGVSVSF